MTDSPTPPPPSRWSVVRERALTLLIGGLIGATIIWISRPAGDAPTHAGHGSSQPAEPTVWTCAMHPEVRRDEPGDCPKCGMDLVPVEQGGDENTRGLRDLELSDNAAALMDIQTAPVVRQRPSVEVRMVGKIALDETRIVDITAWVPGRLERMFVDYTGIAVKRGDHMVELYSPELLSAQRELLLARQAAAEAPSTAKKRAASTLDAARERLRLWGLSKEQVEAIEQRGTPNDRVTINAPSSGIVIHKHAEQGSYVRTGARLYRIADLSQVWVQLEAYENDLAWLRFGQPVELVAAAYPGEIFRGRVSFIAPVLNARSRTVKVRVNVPNADGRLRPEMFVRAIVRAKVAGAGQVAEPSLAGKWISPMHPEVVRDKPGPCPRCGMALVKAEQLGYVNSAEGARPLVVPASAVLKTGTRAIVYVALKDRDQPTYRGQEILLGPRAGDVYVVMRGLREGDRVVTRGAFQIDSALQIEARPSMMTPNGGGGGGHDHGAPKKSADGEKDEHAGHERPKGALSSSALASLATVRAAAARAMSAVEAISSDTPAPSEIKEAQQAFAGIKRALSKVQSMPEGTAATAWREISMRLGNDAAEGASARLATDLQRVATSVLANLRLLDEHFPPADPHAGHSGHGKPGPDQHGKHSGDGKHDPDRHGAHSGHAKPDPKHAALLPKELASYHAIAQALASDDLPAAQKAARAQAGGHHEKLFAAVSKAGDITQAREQFDALSASLIQAARRAQLPADLYVVRCTMAMGGRGASWLQPDRAVRNPFYGKSMLACGEVVETLGGKE